MSLPNEALRGIVAISLLLIYGYDFYETLYTKLR